MMTEPQAKASVHIEEVPKDLEEQVEELHAQAGIKLQPLFLSCCTFKAMSDIVKGNATSIYRHKKNFTKSPSLCL